MDYEIALYRADDLVKIDILINNEPVEALALICHKDRGTQRGRVLLQRLRKQIDRHQFEIPLQAAIGGKIIARETIKAFRKDSPPSATAATSPANANSSTNSARAKTA